MHVAAVTLAVASLVLVLTLGCDEAPLSIVLTPQTSELDELLREADRRWEAAGVAPYRIVIGPGGAPVRFVPERAPIAETRTAGRAGKFTAVRWMELYDFNNMAVAMHEMGHALGIGAASVVAHPLDKEECEPDAANRPLMCPVVGGTLITTRDLELACDAGACTHFAPEAI